MLEDAAKLLMRHPSLCGELLVGSLTLEHGGFFQVNVPKLKSLYTMPLLLTFMKMYSTSWANDTKGISTLVPGGYCRTLIYHGVLLGVGLCCDPV